MAYTGIVTTFRTLGAAASPQTIFTLENTAGSAVVVTLRRLVLQMDATALLASVLAQIKTSRVSGSLPSGGTTLSKGTFDTTQSSAANVVARGATASDGGTATAITATPGTVMWQQFGMRMHSVAGQVLAIDCDLLPVLIADSNMPSFKLAAGEALMVQLIGSATNIPATNHYFVNCVWTEA